MKKKRAIAILCVLTVLIVLGTVFGFVSLDNGELGTKDYIAYPKAIKLGLDLKGGVYAVFNAEKTDSMTDDEYKQKLDGTAQGLSRLLFGQGYTEAQVSVSEIDRQIRVEVPDVDDPDEIFELIGRPATLEFKETADSAVLVSGENLESASTGIDSRNGRYLVRLKFDSIGAEKFADATTQLQGKTMGIYINGELYMEPTVDEVITGGEAVISSQKGYSYEEAYELAVSIQAGAFALELSVNEWETISPTLGSDAIMTGLIAGFVGLLLIFFCLIFWYRLMGVAASIALCLYIMTYLFFMAIFPWVQLTLSGIAGVLLSIGMAVDANVIIFERIKEERRLGKPIASSVNIGFKKSLSAIIDGNVTTLLGTIVMWILGSSTIKGFAITLFIGILISFITALVVTRVVLKFCFLPFNEKSDALYGLKVDKSDDEVALKASGKAKAIAMGGNVNE